MDWIQYVDVHLAGSGASIRWGCSVSSLARLRESWIMGRTSTIGRYRCVQFIHSSVTLTAAGVN
jgi:hypothetical protein